MDTPANITEEEVCRRVVIDGEFGNGGWREELLIFLESKHDPNQDKTMNEQLEHLRTFAEKGKCLDWFEWRVELIRAEKNKRDEIADLSKFHLYNENEKCIGAFHQRIFEFIRNNYDLFVYGEKIYIYHDGVYRVDSSGAELKSIIRGCLFPQFIKAQTINAIFQLFFMDKELQRTFEQLNQYPAYLINFKNGMYDLKKRKLLPHKPEYFSINQIPHHYHVQPIPNEFMNNYIHGLCDDPDETEMLLEYMAYSLTRDTSQQKYLNLLGSGGVGKSVILKLFEKLVGIENLSNVSLRDLTVRFASFDLMGKLLNTCGDLENTAIEDDSMIKKLLGEDRIRGERKGCDAVSFNCYAKLLFSANELPLVLNERTNGFYRRLLVLPIKKKFTETDTHFLEKLEEGIPYLLSLVVEAGERLYARGYIVEPESSKQAVQQLWMDSDTVQSFLFDCCEMEEPGRVDRVKIYEYYKLYCEESDRQAVTRNGFYKSLRTKGYQEEKSSGTRYIKGIVYKCKEKNCPQKLPFERGFRVISGTDDDGIPFD